MSIKEPPVPQFVISSLPGILVEWRRDWPAAGTTIDTGTRWHVVIKADDPRRRQRFSLAHEFKHILDAPFLDAPEQANDPIDDPVTRRLCDYFAACLLMPRPWVKHDFYGGQQNAHELARRYYVSVEAMQTRLRELGLASMVPKARHRSAA